MARTIYALQGNASSGYYGVNKSDDDGANWSLLIAGSTVGTGTVDRGRGPRIVGIDDSTIYAVLGSTSGVWKHNGASWSQIYSGNTSGFHILANEADGWHVTGQLIRRWNGTTFVSHTDLTTDSPTLNYVWTVSETEAYACGSKSGAAVIYRWDGVAWSNSLTVAAGSTFHQMAVFGADDVVAASGDGIYKWNGSTWSNIGPLPSTGGTNARIAGFSSDLFWVQNSSLTTFKYDSGWSTLANIGDMHDGIGASDFAASGGIGSTDPHATRFWKTTGGAFARSETGLDSILSGYYVIGLHLSRPLIPPTITNKSPVPATDADDVTQQIVGPTDPIKFSTNDELQLSLALHTILVRGLVVFDGANFAAGWELSTATANATFGWDWVLIPDPVLRWVTVERVDVQALVTDSDGLQTDESWFFVGVRDLTGDIPFSIYEMLLRSVRAQDEKSPGLLQKLMEGFPPAEPGGFDEIWQRTMVARSDALPTLLDPEKVDAKWLPWLKSVRGFTQDLVFDATEDELRRILSQAAPYWGAKPSPLAVDRAIRLITGNRFKVRGYFDFQMQVDETYITEELQDFDPDVIDFPLEAPNGSQISTCDSDGLYPCVNTFSIADLPGSGVFDSAEQYQWLLISDWPDNPTNVGIYPIETLNVGTATGVIKGLPFPVQDSASVGSWKLVGAAGDYTTEIRLVDPGEGSIAYRGKTSAFIAGTTLTGATSGAKGVVETDTPDPVETTQGSVLLRGVVGQFLADEVISTGAPTATSTSKLTGTMVINRSLLSFLIQNVRPTSERFDVIYVDFLDEFISVGDLEQWTINDATKVSVPSPGGAAVCLDSLFMVSAESHGEDWADQTTVWKVEPSATTVLADLGFMVTDTDNAYFVKLDYAARTITLVERASASDTTIGGPIAAPSTSQMIPGHPDTIRVDALAEGADTRIRVKLDGDTIIDVVSTPSAFTKGKVAVKTDGSSVGTLSVTLVEVNTLPTTVQRIGLNP